MKKHLVIICGVMYPNASATGICAQRFAEILANDYNIDIVCIASDMNAVTVEYSSEIKIHALSGGTMKWEAHCRGILKKLSHFFGQIQIKTRLLGNMQWFSDAALNKLKEIDQENKVDTIFSVCSPLSAHCAALKYKEIKPEVHWVAYTVDLYSIPERLRPFGYTLKELSEKELSILQRADAVFLSEEIYNNHSDIVTDLKNVERLPYVIPYQKVIEDDLELLKRKDINCVFAGSFYPNLRNPEIMLDIFSRINDSRIKLHLYSTGCEDLVKKYSSKCSSIIVHGRVSYEEIQRIYYEANILLNIGNSNDDFTPSKTFEYIATGKPIVNFYYGKEPDNILAQYPLAFHISNEVIQYDVGRIEEFLNNNWNKAVLSKEIERLYPENTIRFIKQLLKYKIG